MRFICAACGKTLDLEGEEARFCPFCGRAYAAAVMEGARADTVQAKYWQMTRAAYGAALRDMADFQGRQSPKKGFCLERLTGASSKNQARQEIERCLAMLAKRLDALKETEQRAPDDAIDTFGRQVARILGGEIPESAPPKEDEKPEEKKKQYDEAQKLLDALTRTQATLNRLMDENGTFIFADAAEAKKAKQPMNEQAEKLIALSQKDYDPIFGESYEPFVAAYMQAMAAVAELVRPKEKDACADARAWAEKLDFLLDQAYQNRKDMMAVWRETDAVCAAFEKTAGGRTGKGQVRRRKIRMDFTIENDVLLGYEGADEYVTIPESVTAIGAYAFMNNECLKGVTIPDSVTSIGKLAFHQCSNLTSINIPEGVTRIEKMVFSKCSSLTQITLPSTVTSNAGQHHGYGVSAESGAEKEIGRAAERARKEKTSSPNK